MIKKIPTFFFALFVVISTSAQITISFDHLPSIMTEGGDIYFVITADNIPNNPASNMSLQIRIVEDGQTTTYPNITDFNLNIESNIPDSTINNGELSENTSSSYSIITTTGTNPNTFKRTYTFSRIPISPNGTSLNFEKLHLIKVRISNDPLYISGEHNEISSNSSNIGYISIGPGLSSPLINKTNISPDVYPNPISGDILNIDVNNISTYKIIDLSGKVVSTKKAKNTKTLDVSSLKPGSYFLITETGISKIIKL